MGQGMREITTNSVNFTRDLVRQGHAWLQMTFPISDSIHARSMNFVFVSYILWVKECKEITTNSVPFTRDLVRQGHAWLQVTFPISDSIHARSMNFFFVFYILWIKECKEIITNSVTLTRDLVRQGHAWLRVTFPIPGSKHARSMNFGLFLAFMGHGMQNNNNQLRNCNAWPCTSRSRVVTSDLSYPW